MRNDSLQLHSNNFGLKQISTTNKAFQEYKAVLKL